MKKPYWPALAALAAFCGFPCLVQAGTPAFPGAEGWGRSAVGGRDPATKILFVTSREDSGPGTLREALKQKGPRIVLFKTGGVIELKGKLSVQEGRLTIAGQTAPGDGVIVRGYPIRIAASDVIVRGLRVRNGDGPGPKGDQRDSFQIGNADGKPVTNVIVDHCSFGWSVDETVEFWYGARDVTLSYCVVSEALWNSIHPKGSHGYALLFGNGTHDRITLHHNLFAHNERRNPWIKDNARVELINNVIYNWGTEATGLWNNESGKKPSSANIIGNYYKGGPDCDKRIQRGKRTIDLGRPAAAGSRFFIQGNVAPECAEASKDGWEIVELGGQTPSLYRAGEPVAGLASGVEAQPAAEAFARVLACAGAVPRDRADQRAAEDTRCGTGRHVDRLEQLGGYPAYACGEYPKDGDGDGMPDGWERTRGLDAGDPSDAVKPCSDGSGYLNIEAYVNGLFPCPAGGR